MSRRVGALLGLLAVLFTASALGKPGGVYTNSTRAAVSWILYDNRDDFKQAPEQVRRTMGALGVPASSHIEVGPKQPLELRRPFSSKFDRRSFQAGVSRALYHLRGKPSPELFVILDSHGNKNVIARQYHFDLPLDEVVEAAFSQVERSGAIKKGITVNLIYSACYSGSIMKVIEKSKWSKVPGLRINILSSTSGQTLSTSMTEKFKAGSETIEAAAAEGAFPGREEQTRALFKLMAMGKPARSDMDPAQVWSNYQSEALSGGFSEDELLRMAAVSSDSEIRKQLVERMYQLHPHEEWVKRARRDFRPIVRQLANVLEYNHAIRAPGKGSYYLPAAEIRELLTSTNVLNRRMVFRTLNEESTRELRPLLTERYWIEQDPHVKIQLFNAVAVRSSLDPAARAVAEDLLTRYEQDPKFLNFDTWRGIHQQLGDRLVDRTELSAVEFRFLLKERGGDLGWILARAAVDPRSLAPMAERAREFILSPTSDRALARKALTSLHRSYYPEPARRVADELRALVREGQAPTLGAPTQVYCYVRALLKLRK